MARRTSISPTDHFWREPGGLDLAMARVRPGGEELEFRFRFGQAYRVAIGKLGRGWRGLLAEPSPDARTLVLCLAGGEFVDVPVERLLAACEPSFRREQASRAASTAPVGVRVRELRRASGRTAMAVAAAAGMARSNYARLEAGRHEPKLETLRRVAKALGLPVTVFFDARRAPATGRPPRRT
jgi:DNA-binding XRE family transcriptional regulator